MDRYTQLSIFLSVFENGSFSAAAQALGISPSAVSKSVTRHEARLGLRLFNRNSRTVRPTLEGVELYEAGLNVRQAMEAAEAKVTNIAAKPSGLLRIHTMPMLAKYRIAPLVPSFLQKYPLIRLEFQLGLEPLNPVKSGADVIVRLGAWTGANLISRRVGAAPRIVCAAPSYLRLHGAPTTPGELQHHHCLVRQDTSEWVFKAPDGAQHIHISGPVTASESEILLVLARQGVGIIRVSEHVVRDDLQAGTLVPLLEGYEIEKPQPIYAAYLSRRHLNSRVRAFVDYLAENLDDSHEPDGFHRTAVGGDLD